MKKISASFIKYASKGLICLHVYFVGQTHVKRLNLYAKLKGHEGCVNTVHFNPSGDLLVSGSDDKQVIFWNWAVKSKKLSYHSGHSDNVFQARIMPFTDDKKVITSAADGQVGLVCCL